jgi:hypothetical protein
MKRLRKNHKQQPTTNKNNIPLFFMNRTKTDMRQEAEMSQLKTKPSRQTKPAQKAEPS